MIMMKKCLFIPKMIMMQMTKFLTKMKVKITMKVTITKVSTKLKKRVEILKCGNLAKKACNSSSEQENQPKDTSSYIQYQKDAKRACEECYNNNNNNPKNVCFACQKCYNNNNPKNVCFACQKQNMSCNCLLFLMLHEVMFFFLLSVKN